MGTRVNGHRINLAGSLLILFSFAWLNPLWPFQRDCFAQATTGNTSEVNTEPAAIPQLPDAEKDPSARAVITSLNVQSFKAFLPAELYDLVKAGKAELPATSGLRYLWRYDDDWIKNSLNVHSDLLSSEGGLHTIPQDKRGFIFGLEDALRKQPEPEARGWMMLWNTASTWWSQHNLEFDVDLLFLKERLLKQRLSAHLSRVYVNTLIPEDKTGQVFREIFRVSVPPALAGLAFLSFQFGSSEEDAVWLYSPATQKARQLTGSNRADGILRSALSLEDILVWSGKILSVAPRFDKLQTLLVPYGGLELTPIGPLKGEASCFSQADATAQNRWRIDAANQVTIALPLPESTIFVPRQLWRLELNPQDPFALHGRQVLYIEPASMLPVYKVVFNRAGMLWKLVIGAYSLGATSDFNRKVPLPFFTLIYDFTTQEISIIDYRDTVFCDSLNENTKLSPYDPRHLGPETAGKEATPPA